MRKMLLIFAVILSVLLAAALLLALAGRHHLKRTIIDHQAPLIGVIVKEHPEAEKDLLQSIMQRNSEDTARGKEILARYGITADDLALDPPPMGDLYRYSTAALLLLPLLAGAAFTAAALLLLQKQHREIRGITRYAGEISRGDYTLDIRDNREGDLSILKNEIYKLTTLLREQAGALQQEKILLADALADISHQLKTPLTSLSVLNDLLSESPSGEKRALFLERMRAQLDRIEWLVSSLLKLSRLDAGAVTMKREPVSVAVLVEKALDSLSIPLELKELRLSVEGNAAVSFAGDPRWSAEALINILKNCIEHTPERGRLQISYEQNPLYTTITIADSGAGIAPEDLPHIFNRFYKGKGAAPDQVGIGLAMARTIIEKQEGDLTVQSKRGCGSKFTIKFYR
jgi:signal transduction histidine kinase